MSANNSSNLLATLKGGDAQQMWHAAEAAGTTKLTAAIPLLFQILTQPGPDLVDADLRRISVWALAQFQFEMLEGDIRHGMNSGNWLLREGVADLLGFFPNSIVAFDMLKKLAIDPIYTVRLWAALSLSKHGKKASSFVEQMQSQSVEQKERELWDDASAKIAAGFGLRNLRGI